MLPKVSLIIPVYNTEKYLERCLESVLFQTYKNIEIIIINDGSIDNSKNIINNYLVLDSRIKYLEQENSGQSKARNLGIKEAKGEYIAFIDSDDYISNDYIENLVIKAVAGGYDIVVCGYTDICKYGQIKLNHFCTDSLNITKDKFIECIFKGVGGTLWGKIFKRKIIEDNKIKMDTNIYMCEDLLFVLEYTMNCKKYGIINKYMYYYNRLNDSSISSKLCLSYYDNFIKVLFEIENILISYKINKNLMKYILSNRFKDIVIKFILVKNSKDRIYTFNERIQIINHILESKYFCKYKDSIEMTQIKEKILWYLLNKNYKKVLIYYSIFFGKLQDLKMDLTLNLVRKEF